ncbi:MAG: ribonuclease Z [Eubacterium sp.]|nr:ribonuclease Z [Eubacterium sp.]
MLDVCLAGTAGMVPLPNRWLTTLYASCEGSSLLIDCGEGTQIALAESGLRLKPIDVICITHFHADHIAGLPGLLLSMGNIGRTDPVTIVGPSGLRHVLQGLLVIAGGLPFDIGVVEIDPDGDEIRNGFVQCGRMLIKAFAADHVIPCLGYTVEIKRPGMFLADKAEALGIPKEYWSRLQHGETVTVPSSAGLTSAAGPDGRTVDAAHTSGTTFMPSAVMGPERRGIKILYSTDTRPVPEMAELGRGADLMILEGNYESDEQIDKAIEWGHMTFPEAAETASDAGAQELWLTHFSQSIEDPENFADNARAIFRNTVVGHDGLRKTIDFKDPDPSVPQE